jgi:hypothetical protein
MNVIWGKDKDFSFQGNSIICIFLTFSPKSVITFFPTKKIVINSTTVVKYICYVVLLLRSSCFSLGLTNEGQADRTSFSDFVLKSGIFA